MGKPTWAKAAMREFGARFAALRIESGETQEGLGRVLGVHRTYVGRLERGEANVCLANILRCAHGLGVAPEDLVRGLERQVAAE